MPADVPQGEAGRVQVTQLEPDGLHDLLRESLGPEAVERPVGVLDHVVQDRRDPFVLGLDPEHHPQGMEDVGRAASVDLSPVGLDGEVYRPLKQAHRFSSAAWRQREDQ